MGGIERHLGSMAQTRGLRIVLFAGQAGPIACQASPLLGIPEDALTVEHCQGHRLAS